MRFPNLISQIQNSKKFLGGMGSVGVLQAALAGSQATFGRPTTRRSGQGVASDLWSTLSLQGLSKCRDAPCGCPAFRAAICPSYPRTGTSPVPTWDEGPPCGVGVRGDPDLPVGADRESQATFGRPCPYKGSVSM